MKCKRMAVELPSKQLPDALLKKFDLDLHLKGAKTGPNGKPRISEIYTYITTDRSYVIPINYARGIMELVGSKIPKQVSFDKVKPKFRNDKFCQQEPVFVEAMDSLRKTNSCFLQLHCGWGKTWMALTIAANLGLRTIVLVHRKFLAGQFMTESQVVIPNQMRIIDNNDVDENTKGNIFVCTDRRALSLPTSFTSTIDFMIVDEAKYWCTPERVKAMLVFRPTHTMGLCAERERRDGYHAILSLFFGHNIFRKSCKPFIVWKYHTNFVPEIKRPPYGKSKIDWNIAQRSISRMKERNEFICNICRLRQKNKIMILVYFQEHVEELEKMLKGYGENVATFYDKADTYSNCRILVASYSKAEMGFDDKNLCENFDGQRLDLLILGSFYKKEIEQSAGRVQRSDAPEVIDIVDNYSSYQKHSKTRDKWFKSRNGRVMPAEYFFDMRKQ
jgi:superfamily II DNA or RNA helicase